MHPLGFVCISAVWLMHVPAAAQNSIDHRLALDRSGPYRAQDAVPVALATGAIAGALYEGSESRLGKTFWQSSESLVLAGAFTAVIKRVARRESPQATDDSSRWFGSGGSSSFPSGHVTITSAAVVPFILEYRRDHPWVWALAALPVFEMAARVKAREHWQTDVLAGAALGAVAGYYTHSKGQPWIVAAMPGGVFVGYRQRLR